MANDLPRNKSFPRTCTSTHTHTHTHLPSTSLWYSLRMLSSPILGEGVHLCQWCCMLVTANNTHSLSREERVPMLSEHRSNVLRLISTLMDSMHTLSAASDIKEHKCLLLSPPLTHFLLCTHRYCGPRQTPPHTPWVDPWKRFQQSWGPGGSGNYRWSQ